MEAAIRGALERAGIPGAQARVRIYDSARLALDRSLERQGVNEPDKIAAHRLRLEDLIANIEAEWQPQITDEPTGPVSGVKPATASADFAAVVHPDSVDTGHMDDDWAPRPEQAGSPTARSGDPVEPPPVASPDREAGQSPRPESGPDSRGNLDFAPEIRGRAAPPPATGAPAPTDFPESERGFSPTRAAPEPAPDKGKKSRKLPKSKPEKRRRPVFAAFFSAAVMLSFIGIGVWWLIESGALTTAEQRDTGVPNPPPSLTRDDFAGGPQQLTPGSGFSGEWSSVYSPGEDGDAVVRANASANVVDGEGETVLEIVSRTGDQSGEVLVPLGADVMQALAGRKSALAISVRSTSSEPTQIYIKCDFPLLGDCGRRRFDVTYDTSDILLSLDYDRALAPNDAGYLVINSDITGGGKGIELLAVRIRPLS
jgi:hypothetical protein